MRKLIIFGAGYVGGEVLRLGSLAGYDCWAVSRHAREPMAQGRWFSGDVSDRASLSTLRSLSGPADLLLYAVSPGGGLESDYKAASFLGPENVLEIFPEARFILISSTRVFGQASGPVIDDETRAEPDDACSAQMIAGETAILAKNPRNVVLRASGIYGPRRTRTADALLTRELAPDEATLVTNRIHRDDLARAVLFLGDQELGGTFIASDPHPVALGAMQLELRRIAQAIGFTAPEAGEAPLTRRAKSRSLRPSRLLTLEFQFQFPSFREGYEDIFAKRALSESYSASQK